MPSVHRVMVSVALLQEKQRMQILFILASKMCMVCLCVHNHFLCRKDPVRVL